MTTHKSPTNEYLAEMRRDGEKKGIKEIPYLVEEIRMLRAEVERLKANNKMCVDAVDTVNRLLKWDIKEIDDLRQVLAAAKRWVIAIDALKYSPNHPLSERHQWVEKGDQALEDLEQATRKLQP